MKVRAMQTVGCDLLAGIVIERLSPSLIDAVTRIENDHLILSDLREKIETMPCHEGEALIPGLTCP